MLTLLVASINSSFLSVETTSNFFCKHKMCYNMELHFFFLFFFHTIDINECLSSSLNPCDQICENTVGSFKCKCKPGFMLDYDGKSCTGKI